jgi:hypothetical protein
MSSNANLETMVENRTILLDINIRPIRWSSTLYSSHYTDWVSSAGSTSEETEIRYLTASLHLNVATDFRFGSLSIRSNQWIIGVLRPDWKWADLSENGLAIDETQTSDLLVGVKHVTSPRLFLSFCPSVYLPVCLSVRCSGSTRGDNSWQKFQCCVSPRFAIICKFLKKSNKNSWNVSWRPFA